MIKKASKHLDSQTIEKIYESIKDNKYLTIIVKIYHTTAIRLAEIEDYIEDANPIEPYINLKPQKNNNNRLLPNVFFGMPDNKFCDYMENITWTRGSIQKQIYELKKNSGVNFSTHDFRATFITNALEKEVPIQKLMALTGHKKLDSLMKYYRINTEHSMYLFEYINQPFESWTKTDDVLFLKQQLKLLSKQNALLVFKAKKQSEKINKLKTKNKKKDFYETH